MLAAGLGDAAGLLLAHGDHGRPEYRRQARVAVCTGWGVVVPLLVHQCWRWGDAGVA